MPEALIIGGGIGGLAAAVALRRLGFDAVVAERAPEIREVGAGLSVWSNAVKALGRLGLAEQVVARGSPIERVRTFDRAGRVLSEMDVGTLSRRSGAPSVCIHRAELQRVLADALEPARVQTGMTCTGFDAGASSATARFADGRSLSASLLIGADGLRSTVRAQLFGLQAPRYAGYRCWRGIAEIVHPDLPAGLGQFAVGRGTQIGIFHCGPGRIYWFATQNGPAHSSEPPEGRKHEALAAFRGWFPLIPAVIESTPEAAILRGDICDRPPAWPWGAGRVTLLGDAIHPTTPNLGQGACQALEDAVQLAASLGRARDPLDGLRDYEQRRRARTAWVTKQSWSLGKVLQWQHPLAVWLRDRASRTRLGQRAAWRLFETLLSDDSPGEPDSHLNWS